MSLKIILIMLALSGVGGVVLGYVLRVLIGLAQRGSVELDIKQKLLQAKEQAAKIIADAEFRGEVVETERLAPIEEREEKVAAREERLASREEFLDSRQRDLDEKDVEVRAREQEAMRAKEVAENLAKERSSNSRRPRIFRKRRRARNSFLKLNAPTKNQFSCVCRNWPQTVVNGLKIKRVAFLRLSFTVSGTR